MTNDNDPASEASARHLVRSAFKLLGVQYREPITEENCNKIIASMLMECAERLGNFPKTKINPKVWDHVIVYIPIDILEKRIEKVKNKLSNRPDYYEIYS